MKNGDYVDGSLGLAGGTATKLTTTLTVNFWCGEFGSQLTTEQRRCHVELTNLVNILVFLFTYVHVQKRKCQIQALELIQCF